MIVCLSACLTVSLLFVSLFTDRAWLGRSSSQSEHTGRPKAVDGVSRVSGGGRCRVHRALTAEKEQATTAAFVYQL